MRILDGLFKNKDKPRAAAEVLPDTTEGRKAMMEFLSDLHKDLMFIGRLDALFSAPIVKHNIIEAELNGASWLNEGKPLIIVFSQKGEPLCAYFKGSDDDKSS